MSSIPLILSEPDVPAPERSVLVEVGWEVCNQIGGIHQVLRSKVPTMVSRWESRYLLLGPWVAGKSPLEFEPGAADGWTAETIDRLAERGVRARYGRWLVAGHPGVVLLDAGSLDHEAINETRGRLSRMGISTESHDPLVGQVLAFSAVVREFFQAAHETLVQRRDDQRVIAHFHEWLSGLAIPLLRDADLPLGIVFTTHATMLGRYLAGGQGGFDPATARDMDPDAEAARLGITAQHSIERAAAHGADVFTTVSAVTAEECTVTLGRTPDRVTPNGLNIDRFNVGHEFHTLHAIFKHRIEELVMGYFFPHHTFDLDRTIYFFTSGRFEPRNKGFDLCLEALARLNAAMKAVETDFTVVFFIITHRPTRSLHPNVLHMRGVLDELREVCSRVTADVSDKLYHLAAARHQVRLDDLVEEYWAMRLKRTQAAFKSDHLPPVTTHVLQDEHNDDVLNQLRYLGFENRPEDRVKVVYSPEFITPTSPIWGIEYDQFVRGCHLGLFPSVYEPWGYTPQECLALGVPAITSDLAGFGRFAMEDNPDPDGWAPWVLPRRGRTFNEAAALLTERLFEFCTFERRDRIALRNKVEARSWDFDWSRLGGAYHAAHELAAERFAARLGSV